MPKRRVNVANVAGDVVVQLATRIPKALYRELKLHAVVSGTTISDLVTDFIQRGLIDRAAEERSKKKRAS
jgi:hypothetical protein